jgi:hypothetical protein
MMNADSMHVAPGRPREVSRLEDLGFGSTLAGFALAAVAGALAPAVERGAALAQWLDQCVTITRTIAAAAFGLVA